MPERELSCWRPNSFGRSERNARAKLVLHGNTAPRFQSPALLKIVMRPGLRSFPSMTKKALGNETHSHAVAVFDSHLPEERKKISNFYCVCERDGVISE